MNSGFTGTMLIKIEGGTSNNLRILHQLSSLKRSVLPPNIATLGTSNPWGQTTSKPQQAVTLHFHVETSSKQDAHWKTMLYNMLFCISRVSFFQLAEKKI